MDRASASEAEGREFDPHRARHFKLKPFPGVLGFHNARIEAFDARYFKADYAVRVDALRSGK
jgi:hypothetical protein